MMGENCGLEITRACKGGAKNVFFLGGASHASGGG